MKSFLLGDDVFISYARGDSSDYAMALANRLGAQKFLCFLDQYGTDIDDELPARLKRKLLRSTVLVLIGSQFAAKSKAIREEIELFKTTERAIIPIDVDGAFQNAELYWIVRGLPLATDLLPAARPASVSSDSEGPFPSDELQIEGAGKEELIQETAENLRKAEPSQHVIDRINSTFTYTKRTQRQRQFLVGGTLFLLVAIAVAVYFLNVARQERNVASQERKVAASLGQVSVASKLINDLPDRALAASLDAYRGAPSTVEARSSLLASLQRYRHLKFVFREYPETINNISFALDGRIVVALSERLPTVNFYDTQLQHTIAAPPDPHSREVDNVSCLPHGDLCASIGDKKIGLWRFTNGTEGPIVKLETTLPVPLPDNFYSDSPMVLVSSELLVSVRGTHTNDPDDAIDELLFWDLRQPSKAPMSRRVKTGDLSAMTASGDGKTLALGDIKSSVYLLKISEVASAPVMVKLPVALPRGYKPITSLSFSPDGKILAVALYDGQMILIDVERGVPVGGFFKDVGDKLVFLPQPSQRLLATANTAGIIAIWDVRDAKSPVRRELAQEYKPRINSLAFLPDSAGTLVTGSNDGSLAFWDANEDATLGKAYGKATSSKVFHISFDESGRQLVTFDLVEDPALWEVNGGVLKAITLTDSLRKQNLGKFSPYVVTNEAAWILDVFGSDFESPHYDVDPPSLLMALGRDQAAVSPNGKMLAVITPEAVCLWDISEGKTTSQGFLKKGVVLGLLPNNEQARRVVFSNDNKVLAAGYTSGEIILWDVNSRTRIKVLSSPLTAAHPPSEESSVGALAFSRDGSMLASTGLLSYIALWDLNTGALIGRLEKDSKSPVRALAFSPDGRLLVSGGGAGITVWDTNPDSWAERALSVFQRPK